VRIIRISAQAFRGFPNIVHFNLSKAVTIIQAPNGFGKTSLSEAFEWTLYGEVARKLRSKTKGEFGQEFLRSAHADPSDETWAEVELLKPDGNRLVIRRNCN
jgi:DNA repair exonuclease SbcCD ATPase subunit